ncbi:hypothetical protein I79_004023 [Cricetulus griseus]|uniref:Uncharacterized protein n=1 Tax=Cricetulus griseus TaxID=10029 RepID=G3H1J5_CRIGR|nr:hypothetical protein I79_004023 [Cricetulus griseus]
MIQLLVCAPCQCVRVTGVSTLLCIHIPTNALYPKTCKRITVKISECISLPFPYWTLPPHTFPGGYHIM